MARIPLPERGQPLDVSYIYQLANALNELANQSSPTVNKNFTVDTVNVGKQSVKSSEARFVGGYIEVANNSTKTAGDEVTFSYDFPTDFKYAPVVTATPLNIGNTPAGKDVSVILKSVSTSKVEGVVKFNSSGDLSVSVNLIAIGIPN